MGSVKCIHTILNWTELSKQFLFCGVTLPFILFSSCSKNLMCWQAWWCVCFSHHARCMNILNSEMMCVCVCFSHHARCTQRPTAGSGHQPLGRLWCQQPRPRPHHGVCSLATPPASAQPQQPLRGRRSQRSAGCRLCFSLSHPAPATATTTEPATPTTAAVTGVPAQPQPFHRHWGTSHAEQGLGPSPAAVAAAATTTVPEAHASVHGKPGRDQLPATQRGSRLLGAGPLGRNHGGHGRQVPGSGPFRCGLGSQGGQQVQPFWREASQTVWGPVMRLSSSYSDPLGTVFSLWARNVLEENGSGCLFLSLMLEKIYHAEDARRNLCVEETVSNTGDACLSLCWEMRLGGCTFSSCFWEAHWMCEQSLCWTKHTSA